MSRICGQKKTLVAVILLLGLLALAACGGSTTQKAKPVATPDPGQAILTKMSTKLNSARTVHGLLNININSQVINGTAATEVWNQTPGKSRTEVHQSTLAQISQGSIFVSDGKQQWQYDAQKNVVSTGAVQASSGSSVVGGLGGSGGGQSQMFLNLVQNVFTRSKGSLRSSSASVAGHSVYDVHVEPKQSTDSTSVSTFGYTGEVYIDKTTQQPVRVNLDIASLGTVIVDIPTLELNKAIDASLFTFNTPAGAKVQPLQTASASTNNNGQLTLQQAQQQAGYHLMSIPGDQADYTLNGVTALGAPGSQTYTLNYMKGNQIFTISEGKSLADLPIGSGQTVKVHNVNATLSSSQGKETLAWTEKGVGIRITGPFSRDQISSLANALS